MADNKRPLSYSQMQSYSRLWEKMHNSEAVSPEEAESSSKETEPDSPPQPVVESAVLRSVEPVKPIEPIIPPKPKQDEPKEHEPKHEHQQEDMIDLSAKIVDVLREKTKEFNKENDSNVTYAQLEKAFLRGANNRENGSPIICALARVHMYLAMRSGKPEYNIDMEKTTHVNFLDLTECWIPDENCFAKAREDADRFNLNCNFVDISDLYITEHKKPIFNLY